MIDKFGKVMVYVKDPRAVADFWIEKIGFTEIQENRHEESIISVEVAPNGTSEASIVLFDRSFVERMSPELHLGTPSILFASYDIRDMRNRLMEQGVTVGEVMEMGGAITFNFSDTEGNYFAVQEIKRS